MRPLVIDFETLPISDIPDGQYPVPVGLAMLIPDFAPTYFAWGHPSGNNCTFEKARHALLAAKSMDCDTLICHNIGFDTGVARQHMGLTLDLLDWHDTQVMAFHNDPHARALGLKPLAAEYADMPDDEAQEVREWLIEHKIVRRAATKAWAAEIWQAPGDLVGKYAVGDVVRTWALFKLWQAKYVGTEGYERDMKATRVGLKMTGRGVLLDRDRLAFTNGLAEGHLHKAQGELAKHFHMSTYDPNDREALADGIERAFGIQLPLTKSGKRATNKDVLEDAIPPGPIKALIRYIGALSYDLKNYLRPWFAAVGHTGGRIHPNWSVTRSDEGGARSGRLASSPNFQNLRGVEGTEILLGMLQKMHPEYEFWTPMIRSLVVPSNGNVLVGRDYSQIELRLTAHYEDGPMAENYRRDPTWDLHAWVIERVLTLFKVTLIRRIAKNIGFGSIYGGGAGAIANQSKISLSEAAEFQKMYFEALPSLRALMNEVQAESKVRAITTLGMRQYMAEPRRYDPVEGRWRDYFYKMLNYLIQGSAADLMKQAMIDADDYGVPLILSVHDEPVADSAAADADDHLEALRVAMEHNDLISRITVPITSNGYVVTRWSDVPK